MVAKTITLPNIRKLFLPDSGYVLCDADLDQADARVVAWDAGCPKLKDIFNDPTKDLHDENAKEIYGMVNSYTRPMAKRGVHATNYVITPRSLGTALGITTREAEMFINTWFAKNPEIPVWHSKIQQDLALTRTITNAFGFRKIFYNRIEHILPEAVAWIPQSTVAICINKGLLNLYRQFPHIKILLQVHDSLVFQVPKRTFLRDLPLIKKALSIPIPYTDPLTIPVSIEVSTKSWGNKKPITWEGDFKDLETQRAAGF